MTTRSGQYVRSINRSKDIGFVLVALLWVLVALSLLALNFASTVRIEGSLAQSNGEAERAQCFARGGLEEVIFQLAFPDKDVQKQTLHFPYADGMNHYWQYQDDMVCHVAIQDEAGKLDLNYSSEETLKRLMDNLGVEDTQSTLIARGIVEWRKAEPSSTMSRSESGLVDSSVKHRPFYSTEELLLIEGVSREIFYGGPSRTENGRVVFRRGLGEFVTVYSGKGPVNVNYAEPEVLAALPGMDLGVAQEIVEARATGPFKSGSDLSQRVTGFVPGEILPQLATDLSKTYCLVATGFRRGSKVRRSLKTVVLLDSQLKARHERLIWYDEYWPSERILNWLDSAFGAKRDSALAFPDVQGIGWFQSSPLESFSSFSHGSLLPTFGDLRMSKKTA